MKFVRHAHVRAYSRLVLVFTLRESANALALDTSLRKSLRKPWCREPRDMTTGGCVNNSSDGRNFSLKLRLNHLVVAIGQRATGYASALEMTLCHAAFPPMDYCWETHFTLPSSFRGLVATPADCTQQRPKQDEPLVRLFWRTVPGEAHLGAK